MKIRGQEVYTPAQRLDRMSKVDVLSGCVEWQGYTSNGYGKLTVGSRSDGTRHTTSAHRLAYETYIGPIPDGMYVCHSCDNRKCINPEHLWAGTHQDNIDDRESKGRNNHTRKLTDDDVLFIHASKHKITSKDLAGMFGINFNTVKHIWTGRCYPRLKPTPPVGE